MKTKLPKQIIRIDDGEVFSLNENGTYQLEMMKQKFPNHLRLEYTYEVLIENFKGHFRPE